MSSRREVLIRILALLQRKTLIETKNRTLKWRYWTVRSIKNVALLTEDGAFALFFRPHPGGFASSRVPTPGNLPSKAKKVLIPGGQPGGGLGAGGIDWCIITAIAHHVASVDRQTVNWTWFPFKYLQDAGGIHCYHFRIQRFYSPLCFALLLLSFVWLVLHSRTKWR